MSEVPVSISRTRRSLVQAAMRRLGEGDASFALARLPDLIVDNEDIRDLEAAILRLAISGKLSQAEASDGTGQDLLDDLKEAGLKPIRAARSTSGHPISSRLDAVPAHWALAPLGDVAEIIMGQSPPGETYNTGGEGLPLINGPAEFGSGWLDKPVAVQYTTKPTKLCHAGDLLVCVRGATTGRTNVAGEEACIGRGVAAIRSRTSQRYLDYFVLALRQDILESGRGSTFPSVSRDDLLAIVTTVPPAKEQQRIVGIVDSLLETTKEASPRTAKPGG